ncbi:MAG: ATP-grasp domain-containing protein [Clostridiales bacterium]|uniref:ATP-grasp domain-containing protein n=1 Tax=Intestinibacter sp. TaxID=1965304 RepID=UPI0025F8DD7F|nr:ATP-grasp domain-containing protein [uncultured Intestinibacter sp.]MDU1203079.1 ATP-grasp domain-containing protein [Clostridiales bacterium]
MNVVFISPNFPLYYYNFCKNLKIRGVNVLGIGDAPYESLPQHMIDSVTEYYKVGSLENFYEVEEACRFFNQKYGKLDWIESQNEYWLETEATLRKIFDVNSGTKIDDMAPMKYKSKMKDVYKSCNIPVARYILISTYENAINFTREVGYPVVVKPDNGVGASSTYKLENDDELSYFFATKDNNTTYIMEEFINGHVETFDGITDSNKNVLISASHVMLHSIMDTVNTCSDTAFYFQPFEGKDIEFIGKKVVKAFDTRSRYFHFEFFRLEEDKEGLGKKGDLVGLEVNMRAPGAYIPDMINYAYDVDTYALWSDVLIYDKIFVDVNRKYVVGYASRRNGIDYTHSYEEIKDKYKDKIKIDTEVPEALAAAMGNHVFIFRTEKEEELIEMIRFILKRNGDGNWI